MDKSSLNRMVGSRNGRPREMFVDRFWSKVNKNGAIMPNMNTPCWVWTAGLCGTGYGRTTVNRTPLLAHRIAWILERDEIPKDSSYHGVCILHRCDNRKCVNPNHLFSGSQADNIKDMTAKGRHVAAPQPGEMHPSVKLTNAKVLEIRMWLDMGYVQDRIAKAYSVSQVQISRIKNRQRWQHI